MKIPAEWEDYVAEQVNSGRFANPGEVIADALSLQRDDHRKLQALRIEVQKGLDDIEAGRISYATADDIIARVKQRQRQKSA
jgi:putative addiction module CopG family antidote